MEHEQGAWEGGVGGSGVLWELRPAASCKQIQKYQNKSKLEGEMKMPNPENLDCTMEENLAGVIQQVIATCFEALDVD